MIFRKAVFSRNSKSVFIAIVAIIFISSVVLISNCHNAIARISWQTFHNFEIVKFFNNSEPELFFEIGNYYFNGGAYDLEKAQEVYSEGLKANPDYPGINYQLARIYFLKGDFQKSYSLINKELSIQPDFKRSYYVRGLINSYSDNLPEAEQDFRSFLEFDSRSWAAYNDLAFVYWKMEQYDKMKETAEKGLSFNPENSWLLISLGNSLMNLGDYSQALETLEKAREAVEGINEKTWREAYPGHYPGDAPRGISQMKGTVLFNKGLIYERLHEPEKAIAELKKLLNSNEENQLIDAGMLEEKIASLKIQSEEKK